MIVGKPWKARKLPRDVSPYSFVVPNGRAKRPNTNLIPSLAASKTPRTASFMNRKYEWRLHDVRDFARLDAFTGKGGGLEAAIQARDEGLVRNISISCHTDPSDSG